MTCPVGHICPACYTLPPAPEGVKRLGGDEPFPEPVCRCGATLVVKSREHWCADAWEAYCPSCYDIGSPHGRGETREAAEEDFFEQEWDRLP